MNQRFLSDFNQKNKSKKFNKCLLESARGRNSVSLQLRRFEMRQRQCTSGFDFAQ